MRRFKLARICLLSVIGLLVTLVSTAAAQQQRGRIQGEVRADNTNRPLAGAQVFIPGTNFGVLTGSTGRYVLNNVPVGTHQVRVQMIGYSMGEQTVDVTANASATANFKLSETAVALDELVVTGTAGVARRKEVGNSISSISANEIATQPVVSTQDIIAARAPGVTVLSNSGQPGAGGTIRLRGNKSISQGNNPLIYVDGVRIYSDFAPTAWAARQGVLPLNDINAEDIERVEIVKGAAATTLYGTEASGGVIQIFTKRGRAGPARWSAELTAGFNDMDHVGPNSDPTGIFLKECRGPNMFAVSHTTGENLPFEDPTCPESGTWLQKGFIQRYSFSVNGGGEALTYYFSGNYNDESGAIETGGSKDGGFRGNFSFRPLENLELMLNTAYTKRQTRWVPDGNNASGFLLNVMRGPFNNFKNSAECQTPDLEACVVNGEILEQKNYNRQDHFITGLTVRHNPGGKLSNRLTIGWDYNHADNQTNYPFGFLRTPLGLMFAQNWTHTVLSFDYVGTLRNEFASRNLTSSFSWGGQLFEDHNRVTAVDAYDFAGPGEVTLTSAARKEVDVDDRLRVINAGFFFNETLGWKDRLFVTAGLRVDGNSAFGSEFGLQPYPKLSVAYVLSDHTFWPAQWWETLRLRGAVGESGKAPGAFDAVRTWEPIAGDEAKPGFTPAQVGNPALGPERTREVELGFESSMFNGRLGLDFTFFDQRTIEALVPVRFPPTNGFENRQLLNVGEIKNRGLELHAELGLLRTEKFDLRGRLNYSTSENEAINIGDQPEIGMGNDQWIRVGYPVPGFWGQEILNPDEIADPVISDTTRFLGPSYPTRTISAGITLALNNVITFDALGEHQGGHFNQNWVGYQNARRGVWRGCYDTQRKLVAALGPDRRKGTADDDPNALAGVTARQRGECAIDRRIMNDEFWVHAADFVKLRTVSLSFAIPDRFLPRGRNAMLTIAGRNLWTSTDYDGADPEVADLRDGGFGITRREYYNLPPLRSFTASLRVSF